MHFQDDDFRELHDDLAQQHSQEDLLDAQIADLKKALDESKKEFSELTSAHQVRDLQIRRLSEMPFPVQHDTTYLITDRFPLRSISVDAMKKSPSKEPMQPIEVRSSRQGAARHAHGDKRGRGLPRQPAKSGEVVQLERLVTNETYRVSSLAGEIRLALDSMEGERGNYRVKERQLMQRTHEIGSKLIVQLHKSEMQCFLGKLRSWRSSSPRGLLLILYMH
jgi:hypothetical protein